MSRPRKCPECDCPMLPKGVEKKPDWYDHASGCPLSYASVSLEKQLAAARAEIERLKYELSAYKDVRRELVDANRELAALRAQSEDHAQRALNAINALERVSAQSEAAVRLAEAFVGYHDARVSHLALRQAEDAYRAARASTPR